MGLPTLAKIIRAVRGTAANVRHSAVVNFGAAVQHPWVVSARNRWPLSRRNTSILLGITLTVAGGYVLADPAVFAAGFRTGGVVAGSLASWIQSVIGIVPGGSPFSILQSWGATMAVPGVAAVIGGMSVVGIGIALTGWGIWQYLR
ncbi:hypothetical protein FA15DRAFT_665382 [Coprinopsis marcescibilis]|uniref:Uncharacterized protein n=1 Tax=Coprinopsis marcescibilis TaxID=230819 RepID=A0A5C3L705_COPMA|nr:hypothetical protein FA15DRAFT_665382 [Coprinopsis marcescibilis]